MTQLGKSTKNIQQIIHSPDTLDSKNYGTLLTSPSFGRFSTNFSIYINERQKQLEAITSQIFDKEKPTYLKDCYYLCNSLLQCTLQDSRFVLLKKPTDRNKNLVTVLHVGSFFFSQMCIYILYIYIYISFKNVLRLSWRPMFSGIKVEVINSKALLIRHNQYCEILCTALAHCKGYKDSPGSSAGKNLPTMQEIPV